jgi:hypothetical protein
MKNWWVFSPQPCCFNYPSIPGLHHPSTEGTLDAFEFLSPLFYGRDRARKKIKIEEAQIEKAKWYLSSIRKTGSAPFLRSFPMEIGWHILGKAISCLSYGPSNCRKGNPSVLSLTLIFI